MTAVTPRGFFTTRNFPSLVSSDWGASNSSAKLQAYSRASTARFISVCASRRSLPFSRTSSGANSSMRPATACAARRSRSIRSESGVFDQAGKAAAAAAIARATSSFPAAGT